MAIMQKLGKLKDNHFWKQKKTQNAGVTQHPEIQTEGSEPKMLPIHVLQRESCKPAPAVPRVSTFGTTIDLKNIYFLKTMSV